MNSVREQYEDEVERVVELKGAKIPTKEDAAKAPDQQ